MKALFLLTLTAPLSLFAILILRLISSFRPVRISKIRADRFGHFIAHPILCHERNLRTNGIGLYWIEGEVCNQFWRSFLNRHLTIHGFIKWIDLWNRAIPGGRHIEDFPTNYIWDVDLRQVNREAPTMPFTSNDETLGRNWLSARGFAPSQRLVCLHVRDSAFLKSTQPDVDWSYHDYRDSVIENFEKGVRWLLDQNIFVIRAGSIAERPLNIQHKNFIDLPFSEHRNDFIDIWLWAVCDMGITSTSGPHLVMNFYNTNWLCVDQAPITAIVKCAPGIVAPKPMTNGITDEPQCFWVTSVPLNSQQEIGKNMGYRPLSKDEIYEIIKEAWSFYSDPKPKKEYHDESPKQFWKEWFALISRTGEGNAFLSSSGIHQLHPQFKISQFWLKNLSGLNNNVG
ncbi:MAG: TIGR04372 family glycosyltransferase [Pseudomonadota bacterium]|nr:TIGR04372 family glycosyltransferase [Pseudomonadota bacterium]